MSQPKRWHRLRRLGLPSVILIAAAMALWAIGSLPGISSDAKGEVDMKTTESGSASSEAVFAGGCFWCMESILEPVPGVLEVISGYTGGTVEDPTYEQVSSGTTGHYEAVSVHFDPAQVSYRELLDVFWRHIDPTDPGGQFHDRGSQYRTAIFVRDDEQRAAAEVSKRALETAGIFDSPIATQILPAQTFYPAEAYHQDYYLKNEARFRAYSAATGRMAFVQAAWSGHEDVSLFPADDPPWEGFEKPSSEDLRTMLTPLQYSVTQENGTERPFQNEYWDHHEEGLYVDVVSGEPLFSSTDKFDSGSGWPSFTRPIDPKHVVTLEDRSLFPVRVEVRSRIADSHLGHVFRDGPAPTGMRYCINSAALRFVPKGEMENAGYAAYLDRFE